MSPSAVHFVVLQGSLRADSVHRLIANALPELADHGVTIELLGSIDALPHYNHDLHETGFPEAAIRMAERIAAADGVIVVTPEYNYSVPGALKNALDWLSRIQPQPFAGKPVAIQTASPGMIGGARAQYHLRQIMVFLNADVLNKPEVMVSLVADKIDLRSGEITDAATRAHIGSQLRALAEKARA